MAEIIDLDFYRKFRVALPLRDVKLAEKEEERKPLRRHRKLRKTLARPLYRNHPHTPDK